MKNQTDNQTATQGQKLAQGEAEMIDRAISDTEESEAAMFAATAAPEAPVNVQYVTDEHFDAAVAAAQDKAKTRTLAPQAMERRTMSYEDQLIREATEGPTWQEVHEDYCFEEATPETTIPGIEMEQLRAAAKEFCEYYKGNKAAWLGNGQARKSLDKFRKALGL